ncbi:hypothetical protein LY90DRAFT_666499 [Neocallimastix californiae]|uniref:EamA domain-containing protein n=1 Tax=Neocallimastix californiae TaxID=1754190 RepID=A0A1Y2ERD1_9FUNG|nr:hypothetical protein LY90DRAFT_666499 [Neocallimastix californiae]|eukprot:ORY73736.1 hypothetical protein LY90DRAFT_666499 [Neocallimastix californiae]
MESINNKEVEIDIKEKEITEISLKEKEKKENQTIIEIQKKKEDEPVDNSRLRKICVNRFWLYVLAITCTFLWVVLFQVFTFAGLLIIAFYCIVRKQFILPKLNQLPDITILGIIGITFQYIFFYFGLSNSTGVKSSIINSLSTFLQVVFAHFIFKNDKITVRKAIGCIVGFLGVVIINLGGAIFGKSKDSKDVDISFSLNGEGVLMLSCVMSSIATIIVKLLTAKGSLFKSLRENNKEENGEKKKPDIIMITGYQMFIGALIIDIIAIIWLMFSPLQPNENSKDEQYKNVSFSGYLLLVYMSLLSAVAFSIWNTLLRFNKVGKIAFFRFLIPVFGTLLSGIFLGEDLFKLENLIALVLIGLSCYLRL